MPRLVEIGLGEGARDYARQVLDEGGPLSRTVAGQLNRLARLYTWGPPGSDPDWVDGHVRHAGVLVPAPLHERGSMVPVVNPAQGIMLDFIASYMRRPGTCLVIDDPWRRPADIQRHALAAVTYDGDHVAHVLCPGGSREAVESILRKILTREWCGVLSRLPDSSVTLLPELSIETMRVLVAAAEHLFLSAFDQEGWIVGDLGDDPEDGRSSARH